MAILCMYITYVCMSPVLFNLAGYLLNATAVVIIWFFSSNDSFLFPSGFLDYWRFFPGGDLGSITS